MGTTLAEPLFDSGVWDIIITESLHFSVSGTLLDGEDFGYDITLDVYAK
jgi:hypothetical protein